MYWDGLEHSALDSALEKLIKAKDQLNDVAGTLSKMMETRYPSVRIYGKRDGALIVALLPGCELEQLNIQAEGEIVRLFGERQAPPLPGDLLVDESFHGRFKRTFHLPFAVESGSERVTLEHGILCIRVDAHDESSSKQSSEQLQKAEARLAPKVAIAESAEALIFKLDMPGCSDLSTAVENDHLTVRGEMTLDVPAGFHLYYSEFRTGSYERDFHLNKDLLPSSLRVTGRDGIFSVTIPRVDAALPRRAFAHLY